MLTGLRLRAVLVTALASLTVAACAPARTGAADPIKPSGGFPRLTWMGEFTRPAASLYPQIADRERFGSLSGLARDGASTQWMAVIDDRAGSRVAWLSISFAGGVLAVSPSGMQALRPGPGVDTRVATQADLEAVVALPDGSFLMSEQGHLIAMERSCWLNAAGNEASNSVQMFAVTLSGNVARKTLLLDLSTLTSKFTPALANLENFEGLAFGPPIEGRPSLLVMSDDNFRATQKTAFLLFGMGERF